MTTSAPLAPVAGRCRWLARPDAHGLGRLSINDLAHVLLRTERGFELRPNDRSLLSLHLPADLSACDCGEAECCHRRALKALLAVLTPVTPKPARKPHPCMHCAGTGRFRMNTRRGVRIEDCRWCNCTGIVEGF